MLAPTGYHALILQLGNDLVNHGWGEAVIKVSSGKDNTVRLEISCGKSYVFFIKKNMPLNDKIL